jgi:hypothetical protein
MPSKNCKRGLSNCSVLTSGQISKAPAEDSVFSFRDANAFARRSMLNALLYIEDPITAVPNFYNAKVTMVKEAFRDLLPRSDFEFYEKYNGENSVSGMRLCYDSAEFLAEYPEFWRILKVYVGYSDGYRAIGFLLRGIGDESYELNREEKGRLTKLFDSIPRWPRIKHGGLLTRRCVDLGFIQNVLCKVTHSDPNNLETLRNKVFVERSFCSTSFYVHPLFCAHPNNDLDNPNVIMLFWLPPDTPAFSTQTTCLNNPEKEVLLPPYTSILIHDVFVMSITPTAAKRMTFACLKKMSFRKPCTGERLVIFCTVVGVDPPKGIKEAIWRKKRVDVSADRITQMYVDAEPAIPLMCPKAGESPIGMLVKEEARRDAEAELARRRLEEQRRREAMVFEAQMLMESSAKRPIDWTSSAFERLDDASEVVALFEKLMAKRHEHQEVAIPDAVVSPISAEEIAEYNQKLYNSIVFALADTRTRTLRNEYDLQQASTALQNLAASAIFESEKTGISITSTNNQLLNLINYVAYLLSTSHQLTQYQIMVFDIFAGRKTVEDCASNGTIDCTVEKLYTTASEFNNYILTEGLSNELIADSCKNRGQLLLFETAGMVIFQTTASNIHAELMRGKTFQEAIAISKLLPNSINPLNYPNNFGDAAVLDAINVGLIFGILNSFPAIILAATIARVVYEMKPPQFRTIISWRFIYVLLTSELRGLILKAMRSIDTNPIPEATETDNQYLKQYIESCDRFVFGKLLEFAKEFQAKWPLGVVCEEASAEAIAFLTATQIQEIKNRISS